MSEPQLAEDSSTPAKNETPAPEGSRPPPQEQDPVTAKNRDNPAF